MTVIVPRRQTRTLRLNTANYFAQYLIAAAIPKSLEQSTNGVTPTSSSSSIVFQQTANGECVTYPTSGSGYFQYAGSWSRVSAANGFSLLTDFILPSVPAGSTRLSGNFSTSSYGYTIAPNNTNIRYITGPTNSVVNGSTPVAGKRVTALGVTDATYNSLFENGVLTGAKTAHGGVTTPSGEFRLYADNTLTSGAAASIFLWALFSKAFTPEEARELSANPWQLFAPRRQLLYVSTTSVQLSYLRPASDITTGSWSPSTGTTLYGVLDEVTADDADYIQASTATGCEIKLSAGSTPTSRDNHTIKYRLLAGSGNIAVVLKCGSTTIKSWNHVLTGSAQDFSQALSNAEATNITDYSDLRVTFTSS